MSGPESGSGADGGKRDGAPQRSSRRIIPAYPGRGTGEGELPNLIRKKGIERRVDKRDQGKECCLQRSRGDSGKAKKNTGFYKVRQIKKGVETGPVGRAKFGPAVGRMLGSTQS